MDQIKYLDFDLLIERAEAGYTARVLYSPAGQGSVSFSLPFSALELENFFLRVGRTRRGARRLESPEMEAAKTFGGRLFEAVFDDEVRACLRSSLDEASRQGAGLRIRLRLTGAPEIADIPWEYLYNPALNRFLSLSVETPLVRYLDLPERIQPLTVKPPLRILVMISSPSNHPPLDVDKEWARLKEALADLEQRGLVTLEKLEQATLYALQRQLRRGGYHIFHFVGHGAFDQRTQDGVLLMEDEAGLGRPVSGQDLGMLLHDERTLRLAILNACEGARTSRSDPFAGVAQSLVQQGIPAVIAMQFEITDEAAITLAHEFYAAMADGYPVDAALAEARKAIFAQGNDVEWGKPVLHLRAPNGHIFTVEQVNEEERRNAQIAALYRKVQMAMAARDWPTAITQSEAILSVDPTHVGATSSLSQARQQQELATAAIPQPTPSTEQPGVRIAQPGTQTMQPVPPKPKRWLWGIVPVAVILLIALCIGSLLLFPRLFGPTSPAAQTITPTTTQPPTATQPPPASTATPEPTPTPFSGREDCQLAFSTGEWETALEKCSLALDLDPSEGAAFAWRGLAYFELGDCESAIADLERYLLFLHAQAAPEIEYGLDEPFVAYEVLHFCKRRYLVSSIPPNYVQLDLIATYDVSEDGLTYTFFLVQGVQLSNGMEFNAYATDELLFISASENKIPTISNRDELFAEISILDQYTLQVTLFNPDPQFLAKLGLVGITTDQ